MEKIKVEIDIDSASRIFGVVLKQQYLGLSPLKEGTFSIDKEENKREHKALKDAYRMIMSYNGVKL